MGEIKQIKARVVFKHEKAEDWEQSSYVPAPGEKVLYDPDEYHAYTRVKYGDGEKAVKDLPFSVEQVDWEENDPKNGAYIKNRPFYKEERLVTIDRTGQGQFNESFDILKLGNEKCTYTMVSNLTPTADELIGSTLVYTASGYSNYTRTIIVTEENLDRGTDYTVINVVDGAQVLITYKDRCIVKNFEYDTEKSQLMDGVINKKGMYFTSRLYVDIRCTIDSLRFLGKVYSQIDNRYIQLSEHPDFSSLKTDLYDSHDASIEIRGHYDISVPLVPLSGQTQRVAYLISFNTYTPEQLEGAIVLAYPTQNIPLTIGKKTDDGFLAYAQDTNVHVAYNTDYIIEDTVKAPQPGTYVVLWSDNQESQSFDSIIKKVNYSTLKISNSSLPLAHYDVAGMVKSNCKKENISGYEPAPVVDGVPYYKDTTYSLYSTKENSVKGIEQFADNCKDGIDAKNCYPYAKNYDDNIKKWHDGTEKMPYGAIGLYSAAFGGKSTALGKRAFAEGTTALAKGSYSHAEGSNTVSYGTSAHAEGVRTFAYEQGSHAEGEDTQALGRDSHAEGFNTIAEGYASHAEGFQAHATGMHSHAEGANTWATNAETHAEGRETQARGEASHSEGANTKTYGFAAHAEGYYNEVYGTDSHAEGYNNKVYGKHAHVEGANNVVGVEGQTSEQNYGDYSHVGGNNNVIYGTNIFAHGSDMNFGYAYAGNSHTVSNVYAFGRGLYTVRDNQFITGHYNADKYGAALIVGNGSEAQPSNAFEVFYDGRAAVQTAPYYTTDVIRVQEFKQVLPWERDDAQGISRPKSGTEGAFLRWTNGGPQWVTLNNAEDTTF